MKKYISIIAGLLVVPSIASAAWWNPGTWFGSGSESTVNASSSEIIALTQTINQQNAEISQLQAELSSAASQAPTVITKTTTQTVKDPTEEATISSLTQQLAAAQSKYAICQGQLSSASTANTQTTTANVNSAQIQSINEELANLTQIDFDINNAPLQFNGNSAPANSLTGTTTLISVLNGSMKLDGSMLFPNTLGEWYVTATAGLQPTTSTSTLHSVVQAYRNQLEGQLQSLGAVTNTMNINQ